MVEKSKRSDWCGLLWVIVPWGVMIGIFLLSVRTILFDTDPATVERVTNALSQLGTFGDMFGVVTCLFTGLAVYYANRAYVAQRLEMDRTAKSFALQTKLNAFQSMVGFYRERFKDADKPDDRVELGRSLGFQDLVIAVTNQLCSEDLLRQSLNIQDSWTEHLEQIDQYKANLQDVLNRSQFVLMVPILLNSVETLSRMVILAQYGDRPSNAPRIRRIGDYFRNLHSRIAAPNNRQASQMNQPDRAKQMASKIEPCLNFVLGKLAEPVPMEELSKIDEELNNLIDNSTTRL
ncbi:hypothetical protein [Tuwongella immobilis]|uniref:Uncharacterized protein n=1 Tax=Tuwongella immobilis TaxID=692036 RepID=A0A6C2YGG3_9BACT|nr:hypothetical protein [Tuwongella immobilis]VIP00610.1 unnamed protein product [Tuwongella immobilis]VTR96638.1 unnamed protein product [Tuwongella immobilis]